MKCLRFPLFAFIFILSLVAHPSRAEVNPCNPNAVLSKILGVRDQTSEWLAKIFQSKAIKNFDTELYLKSLDEFENLKVVDQLPKQPPIKELERNMAWLDAQTSNGQKLPDILHVLKNGTETQKFKLKRWINHYSDQKLTEHQVKVASTDLSLILNNTKYNITELYKHGASELANQMVTSQFHQSILEKQMMHILKENDLIKSENILNAINRLRTTSPGKWLLTGGTNGYTLYGARKWRHVILFALPDHQFAKLAVEDLELLMKTGGVDSIHFKQIAAKYEGKVTFQAFYNSFQSLSTQVARILWIDFGIRKYQQYQERKEKLNQKHFSSISHDYSSLSLN